MAYKTLRPPVVSWKSETRDSWRAIDCVGDELGVGPEINQGCRASDGIFGGVADGVVGEGSVDAVRECVSRGRESEAEREQGPDRDTEAEKRGETLETLWHRDGGQQAVELEDGSWIGVMSSPSYPWLVS